MTEAATMQRHHRPNTAVRELDNKLAMEIESVMEETERAQRTDQPETNHWSYKIPQAGVRYYSF